MTATPADGQRPAVRATHLTKTFAVRGRSGRAVVRAVDDVSFEVPEGKTLALVGESGCGKSTTARMVANLLMPTEGVAEVCGTDLAKLPPSEARRARQMIQLVFQDPFASLDPKMTAGEIVAEPLRAHGRYSRDRIAELFRSVQLDPSAMDRRPRSFSGGQRQRINIARALALEPRVVLLDEPTSALDVSIQAQILALLRRLQQELGMTYIVISHDLAVVRQLADRVAVMYLGQIVEEGPVDHFFDAPRHPYTKALLSAVPAPDPDGRTRKRIILSGDPPNAAHPPSGCRFHTRCWKADQICSNEEPSVSSVDDLSHRYKCHHPEGRETPATALLDH